MEKLRCTVFYGTANSAGPEVSFWGRGVGEDALKRWLGCVILSLMPEEGLEEALLSLKDILEFRSYTKPHTKPRISHHTTGKVVSKSQRPDLVVSE